MDILTRSQLSRAAELIADAAKSPGPRETSPNDAGAFLDLSRRDVERYSLSKAINGKVAQIQRGVLPFSRMDGPGLGLTAPGWTGLEADCHRDLCRKLGTPAHQGAILIPADVLYRDLTVSASGAGGYLAGTKNVGFIDVLRSRAVVFQLGAERLPDLREHVTIPRQSTSASITWQSTEATTASESTPQFQQVAGTPKTAIAYIEFSHQLLQQSSPAVDALLTMTTAADLAVGVDLAVLTGSGTAGQPLGILNTTGIGAVAGTSLAYGGLVEAQVDIADNNAVLNGATLGYVTTPTIAQTLKGRQRFTNTDSPLWAGAIHEGTIEGVRALSTKQMPTATLLYGDWSQAVVAEWGVLEIQVNPFADFKAGVFGLRAIWSVDVLVRNAKAFTAAVSIT